MMPRRKPLPPSRELVVETLSHDGRGIARPDGKTTFIDGALPGETVLCKYTMQRGKFDEARTLEVKVASEHRVTPPCSHADRCGGCSLQHLDSDEQVHLKQSMLEEQLRHFGGLAPQRWLEPLRGPVTGYRSKARLGVKYVEAREQVLVGFREKRNSFIAALDQCSVLVPSVGKSLRVLAELMATLDGKRRIPQIEVAAGDEDVALIFRHLDPLSGADQDKLVGFCQSRGWHCYLQPGNEQSVHRVWPTDGEQRLTYEHPSADLEMAFHPTDFTQVNGEINRAMVPLALELLDVQAEHRVLDLFCGLGNFTLPLARRAAHVSGVEGSQAMVERGYENARRNSLSNVDFYAFDLTKDVAGQSWATARYDRVLVDPPRTGALEMMPVLAKTGAQKVVYVSCNPATLARDAGELVKHGYRLVAAGVMDMFPHTTHVESIALFER
ncbi:23S rRNA (uracil(1939)-C(5))-methyltransferase RlmD [Alcanivorax sp. 1008]|uniref:23S rRNA (uracil(1939)-C(5))-methyltransferase RlmD n=1 Tax=Alcanivorax sp. 1008 TaxID=2816853 RepID=UPI001D626443|nr:23S rRNA (uracil(1939)-C(5))-methyltransferase RlmD [Alcanivorax sp. 1008]MCC1495616.1 23S rRNA (uracil(1939)-C(5))-methyltransferase RlmD [Alcanivorax sp. 1008]